MFLLLLSIVKVKPSLGRHLSLNPQVFLRNSIPHYSRSAKLTTRVTVNIGNKGIMVSKEQERERKEKMNERTNGIRQLVCNYFGDAFSVC